MANIAIIGTPGAGKTVFLSVLAMRYRVPTDGRPWLEFKNRETQRYVTEAWDTLQNEEWPPSTPPGRFPTLDWNLRTSTGEKHTLVVRDPAGQDVRAIYDAPEESRTEEQRELKRIFDAADMLLFLINLRPAMDAAGNQGKIDDIEIPLKMAIEDALEHRRRVAILVTQHDIIAEELGADGLDPATGARAAICRFLPQVGGILQAHPEAIGTHFVASVAETKAVMEGGKVYRRPKSGFPSQGLDEILNWVEQQMPEVEREHSRKADARRLALIAEEQLQTKTRRETEAATYRPQFFRLIAYSAAALVVAVLAFLLFKSKAFDQLHKSYYDGAVVEKVVPVEKERHTDALPSSQFTIRNAIDLSRDESSWGDRYRDITFVNNSGKPLYSVVVYFSWQTSIMNTRMNTKMSIANIGDGESATASSLIYCNTKEWSRMFCQVSCFYRETVMESQWVHDHTKDDAIRMRAQQESLRMGYAGSALGILPFLTFAVSAVRVRNRIVRILNGETRLME